MAEESEKRFHAVMDKLFFAPPPNSKPTRTPSSTSATAVGFFRGKKRSHMMTTPLAVVYSKSIGGTIEELRKASGETLQSPMCRPWDRDDLLNRLATFKSMTWFAKPEVVSAINCARRGWVNVDMDIIACESCGARLFFSTPSSWAQQQVENAASVFSLKLNNGHKLLCPWVDNACDEKLAQFPPSSSVDLVDNYKKRCASLLQLLELPVISSTAINYMWSPLLENFLKNSPTLENVYGSDNASTTGEEVFPVLYYQAQKVISLCGWEPRLLPYIVDCKDLKKDESIKHNSSITVYSSNLDANNDPSTIEQYDHTSIVLVCRLCGAKVGLWAFRTTPQPPEFFRLIGQELNEDSNSENKQQPNVEQQQTVNRSVLNLTIAGGPPPADQNFRPTISLPVVGQNLRTRFSFAFESAADVSVIKSLNSIPNVDNHQEGGRFGIDDNEGESSSVDHQKVLDSSVVVSDSSSSYLGKDSTSTQPNPAATTTSTKAMEFDPIKQHRHFCPWITSTGKSAPGWKQTLSALQRQKEFLSPPSPTPQQPSSSLIQVSDPVGSVKKLLTPPSAKRHKFTHGST
ncbi:unnamed protein product [Lactuca virosa]|uniref:C3HC-type domain-containing protein n=1 Tax=Lactuca virosa TaxID=75947 RepID=A0AAU9ME01_9ASTR|nr:unnamed protein product [Lactuca virosa]